MRPSFATDCAQLTEESSGTNRSAHPGLPECQQWAVGRRPW